MYPLVEVGEVWSPRCPDNYFEKVEQTVVPPTKDLQKKMVTHFRKADEDHENEISKGIGLRG
jgi:catalase